MRLTVDKSLALGNQVEFDALSKLPAISCIAKKDDRNLHLCHNLVLFTFSDGSQIEPLTSSLAAKCGFSIDSDPWGNYKVFASLLNCFAANEVTGSFWP